MLTRGCFPKIQNPDLPAVDNNYCYSVDELEELPSVVTILEDYQNLTGVGLRVKDGVLCPCDESYGNDQIYKQLLKAGDKGRLYQQIYLYTLRDQMFFCNSKYQTLKRGNIFIHSKRPNVFFAI